jgi:hypothetical protein
MPEKSPIPAAKLTHMRPGEIALFRRFETLAPLDDALYDFDVRLGRGMPLNPAWPPWLATMATALTQKRVDVVALTSAGTWILEIKPRAGPGAVGQLLTYLSLYAAQHPELAPFHLGVICDRNSFDMLDVYRDHAIQLFLV